MVLVEGEIRGDKVPTSICGVGLMHATFGFGLVVSCVPGNWDKEGLGMVLLRQGDTLRVLGT